MRPITNATPVLMIDFEEVDVSVTRPKTEYRVTLVIDYATYRKLTRRWFLSRRHFKMTLVDDPKPTRE
jgi:hypothetical protein